MLKTKVVVLALMLLVPFAAQAFSFTPGNIYAATDTQIEQFDADGKLIDTINPYNPNAWSTGLRGLAFGTDGLYVVRTEGSSITGSGKPSVDVLDSSGALVRSYAFSGWIGGLATAGQIVFSNDKQSFYVGASDGVYQFDVNGTTGRRITFEEANSIAVLPNGDLLASRNYEISRYTSAGVKLGSLGGTIQDPQKLTAGFNDRSDVSLTDVRGIAYDERTNTTFVSMLGYSGGAKTDLRFKLLALDGFTPVLKDITSYWYGSQMHLTEEGQLLVGSWTQAPGVFSTDLDFIHRLGSKNAIFVTSMPVPEADSMAMLCTGLIVATGTVAQRRRRQAAMG